MGARCGPRGQGRSHVHRSGSGRRIEHAGTWFAASGYPNTARNPQGTPVIYQAGSSAEGRTLGGRHAECVFLQGTTVPGVRGFVEDIRAQAAAAGRDPLSVKTVVGVSVAVAPDPGAGRGEVPGVPGPADL